MSEPSPFERCFASELPEEVFEPASGTRLRLRMMDAADASEFERRMAAEVESAPFAVYCWLISRVILGGSIGGRELPADPAARENWLREAKLTKPVFDALGLECLRVCGYGAALGN